MEQKLLLVSCKEEWERTFALKQRPAVKYLVPAFNIISNEDKWTDNPRHLQLFAELYRNCIYNCSESSERQLQFIINAKPALF